MSGRSFFSNLSHCQTIITESIVKRPTIMCVCLKNTVTVKFVYKMKF